MSENEKMTAEELAAMEAEEQARLEAEERARIEHENFLNSFPEATVFYSEIISLDGGSVRKLGSWVEDAHTAEAMKWDLNNNMLKTDLTFKPNATAGGIYYLKGYEPAEETREEMIARRQTEIVNMVQNIIDETAQQKRYDDGLSCVSYVGDPDEEFNADAVAFVAWRGRCWRTCYNILNSVTAGTVAPEDVTDAYVIERLPVMEWPKV